MLKYSNFKWIIGIPTGLTAVAVPVGLCIQQTQEIKQLNKDIQDKDEIIKWKEEKFEKATNVLDQEIKEAKENLRKVNNEITAKNFAKSYVKWCLEDVNKIARSHIYNWWSALISKFEECSQKLERI